MMENLQKECGNGNFLCDEIYEFKIYEYKTYKYKVS